MNIQERDIMKILLDNICVNQRALAEASGHSLGVVNRSVNNLMKEGYLDRHMCPTQKAKQLGEASRPRHAVILAAGFGMRMVPINLETPKALLEVKGEVLIGLRQTGSRTPMSFPVTYGAQGIHSADMNYTPGTWSVSVRTRRATCV